MSVSSLILYAYWMPLLQFGEFWRRFSPVFWLVAGIVVSARVFASVGMLPDSGSDQLFKRDTVGPTVVFLGLSGLGVLVLPTFMLGLAKWIRYLVNDEPYRLQRSWLAYRQEDHLPIMGLVFSAGMTLILGACAVAFLFVTARAHGLSFDSTATRISFHVVAVFVMAGPIACFGCFFTLHCLSIIGLVTRDGVYKWYAAKRKIALRDRLAFGVALIGTLAPVLVFTALLMATPNDWPRSIVFSMAGLSIYLATAIVVATMLSLFYRYRMARDQTASAP